VQDQTDFSFPPGPRRPPLVQTLEWVFRPVPFMEACRRRYGDCFTAALGPMRHVVFISEPEAVKQVLTGDPSIMHMGDINGLFRPILGSSSLLLLDGEEHMRHRRLMLPPFHGRRMHGYGELMSEIAENELETWPVHQAFPLLPRMQTITTEVILRAVFGVEEGSQLTDLRRLVVRLLDRCRSRSTMLPQLRRELGGRSPWARLMRTVDDVDEVLLEEIRRRRSQPASELGDDVLSLLVQARDDEGNPMSDRELRDELLTLLVAGHETTATALAWTFERLVRHPSVLARLTDELATGDTSYLDAVIKETLRLRPVLPIVARKLAAPYELNGYRFPKGTVLMPSIYLLHRHPSLYPNPDEFWPERFLDRHPDTYAWIPFGGGVRRCLGGPFAQFEMNVVLRTVLSRVTLEAAGEASETIARRSFTFAPERGAMVVLKSRAGRSRRFRIRAGAREEATAPERVGAD
jgi:cytochrome P450